MTSGVKLGVDIDDVIADFVSTLAVFHNDVYGTNLTKEDFISYDFWKVWSGSKEEAVRKVNEMFDNEKYYKTIPVIEQSFASLEKIKESGTDLYVITGRRDNMVKQTEEWISEHFPGIFSDIYFTNSYSLEGKSKKKSEICRKIGITVMIEDHIKHAIDCAEKGVQVFLFDCPWNRSLVDFKKTRRVFSWNEILQML